MNSKDLPSANSGSSAATSDMSMSRMSLAAEGLSIDIARACCSRAFSSSYHPELTQIIRIVFPFLPITYHNGQNRYSNW